MKKRNEKMRVLTVNLQESVVSMIDKIVDAGLATSRSELIRFCLLSKVQELLNLLDKLNIENMRYIEIKSKNPFFKKFVNTETNEIISVPSNFSITRLEEN